MPTTVSYPGVYIEEVPSGVRAIAGVETSVTAFLGYTKRGPTNKAAQIFSYADFERTFGGLSADSDLSYAVQHFFLNGGAKGWVVRVAAGASAAAIDLKNGVGGADPVVLTATARSEGDWGNHLVVTVDYDSANPASLFNLSVVERVDRNGTLVVARSEVHRNLSMNSFSGAYAPTVVNANSSLITLARPAGALAAMTANGTARGGDLEEADLDALDDDHRRLAITLDGDGPYEFDVIDAGGALSGANLDDKLDDLADRIEARVQALKPGTPAFDDFTCARDGATVLATSGTAAADRERSSVAFSGASLRNAATLLKLGVANGGREASAAAAMRPAPSGTVGARRPDDVDFTTLGTSGAINVVLRDAAGTAVATEPLTLWTEAANRPADLAALRPILETALHGLARSELAQASVALVDDRLVVTAGGADLGQRLEFTESGGTVAEEIGLITGAVSNLSAYQLGVGPSAQAESGAQPGNDGTPPNPVQIAGSRAAKSGLYALEDADLFNILTLPGQADTALLSAAIAYAEERRAFVILDLPSTVDTLDEARTWLSSHGTLRHKNAAAYFPRVRAADPLQQNRLRPFPNSGAMAGLYARTDGARGVWKAPAGTEAALRGVQALEYTLTDPENGVLNPLGLNCLRNFPAFGSVAWGARTLVGSDQLASEWKYVPVRRVALFIEESLYRGTQWVVFEPNDEPLWAQIRLNVGAFMHNLFRQGAFQGTTPREAYLVKCDRETTTQDDINLGIVNIIVGFAPLKPAEFVIIKLQQLAGQSQA
jgi:phage tail sheath protein FI